MSYRKSLEDLRQQLFATNEEVEAPKKKYSGIISAKVEQEPLKAPSLPSYYDWLRGIKQSAELIQAEAPKQSGGFAEGLAQTLDLNSPKGYDGGEVADPVSKIPEERRDTFIKRRGDGPSYYGPRDSSAASFLEIMDKHEGGGDYDTLFQHSQRGGGRFSDVKVSEMTLGELKAFAGDRSPESYYAWSKKVMPSNTHAGKTGQGSTPMGRYQFVGSTLKEVANEMGLSDDTVFTPEVQDAMFEHYLQKRISMGKTVDEKINHLRSAWEGFNNVDRGTLANLITKYGN